MALSFDAWLKTAGYSQDWYNKLDVMHQMQAQQAYRELARVTKDEVNRRFESARRKAA